jgi:hypothetical protein
LWRQELLKSAAMLESTYELLLYGSDGEATEDHPFPVPPAAFTSMDLSNMFFKVNNPPSIINRCDMLFV